MERRRPRRHWHRGSLLSHQTQKPKKKFKNEKASQGKKLASIVAKNLSPKARRWMIVIRKDTKKSCEQYLVFRLLQRHYMDS